MGKMKRLTAVAHLGILETAPLVIMLLVWGAGIYEAYFLTKIQSYIYTEPFYWVDILANSILVLAGSLSAMVLPTMYQNAKSEFSPGGVAISMQEILLIGLVTMAATIIPIVVWHKCVIALDEALALDKITKSVYKLRLDTIVTTIWMNIFLEFLLGVWSTYELNAFSNKLTIYRTGNKAKQLVPKSSSTKSENDTESSSTTKTVVPNSTTPPVDDKTKTTSFGGGRRRFDEKKLKNLL